MADGCFDLRCWFFSGCSEDPIRSVLGLKWNMKEDTLPCELIERENKDEQITKQKILSLAHQLFDPIGFTCPITLIPKLLLQECWQLGISWDAKLPEDIIKRFDTWKGELPALCSLKIPHRLSDLDLCESNLTLHFLRRFQVRVRNLRIFESRKRRKSYMSIDSS
ncbi:integrase_H2C2 domain-containing protein [Trichonephila clavipes]|nr:integrase_H2C2 domain-containing protein [Trichonephila clavipes]